MTSMCLQEPSYISSASACSLACIAIVHPRGVDTMGSSDAGSRHWNATAAVYPGLQGARNENRLNNTRAHWAQAHWAEAFIGLRPSGPQFEPGHWAAQTRLVNIFATFFLVGYDKLAIRPKRQCEIADCVCCCPEAMRKAWAKDSANC